jgi:hypothetical protein
VPVDRPLLLFHARRAIALFGMKRSIALYYFFSGKGDRTFGTERSIALYDFFTLIRAIALFGIAPSQHYLHHFVKFY